MFAMAATVDRLLVFTRFDLCVLDVPRRSVTDSDLELPAIKDTLKDKCRLATRPQTHVQRLRVSAPKPEDVGAFGNNHAVDGASGQLQSRLLVGARFAVLRWKSCSYLQR
jgi:hypothetical protein